MARPQLRSPNQPWPVRVLLGIYEFCASLKLAVVLIFACAIVLGWGTFVESWYGLRGVHFGIWQTWWFAALNALLALNIFCAAAIRYPWKRHQTGFVITHIGLLTMLAGGLWQRLQGIDAQMPIWENAVGRQAVEDSQHLLFTIQPDGSGDATAVAVRFEAGPFNWQDYDQDHWLPFGLVADEHGRKLAWHDKRPWFPWGLSFRGIPAGDRRTLAEHGIDVEVLDYYSDSQTIDVPWLRLKVSAPRMPRMGADGREELGPEVWVPVELRVKHSTEPAFHDRPLGVGERRELGGGTIVFWLAGGEQATQAFLGSAPEGELGEKGQVILHAAGQRFVVNVAEKVGQPKFPLGETGYSAELTKHFQRVGLNPRAADGDGLDLVESTRGGPADPAVELLIHHGDGPPRRMVLFADIPELSLQDWQGEVFGDYWFNDGPKTTQQKLAGEGKSRIDVIQGASDAKPALFYRYWNGEKLVTVRDLPLDKKVDAFKMPIAQLQMVADKFLPADKPGKEIIPRKFNKDTPASGAFRAAKLRVTVDGNVEEFWLSGPPPDPLERPLPEEARRVIQGNGRKVAVTMPLDTVDVGFGVRLRRFERRLDPGTSQASHYTSWVDFVSPDGGQNLRENVEITMNAPVDFSAPGKARSYRLFQEGFNGPYRPGDGEYELRMRGVADRPDQIFLSTLTVNYDPGRGIKYLGCLLVVAGIATMFYMRAYFFKPKAQPAAKPRKPAAAAVH
jgi:hypothetical protein